MREVELVGGPMDGKRIMVNLVATEVEVTMEDLSRHLYSSKHEMSLVFIYEGRI